MPRNRAVGMQFLPTPSARRATYTLAAPWGCSGFLPTPSARRATYGRNLVDLTQEFLPTPSARRATCRIQLVDQLMPISTHALREEGDIRYPQTGTARPYFYPRPPRGGRPSPGPTRAPCGSIFLPTPSARRATRGRRQSGGPVLDFYPRPPRGGRPAPGHRQQQGDRISTHALREEGDRPTKSPSRASPYFYPRPPRGGRPSPPLQAAGFWNFYPRPPRGGRHYRRRPGRQPAPISTHALREEGDGHDGGCRLFAVLISTHALREEGDPGR